MANFNMHLNTAAVVSGTLAATLSAFHFIDIKTSFYCFFAGIIGGILPDIDHENSIPVRILQFVLANLIAFLIISNYLVKLKLLEIIGIWIGVYLVFEGLFYLFKKYTTHRGIIHSIPVGVLFSLMTILFLNKVLHLSIIKSYYIGIFLLVGYLTHLILDEIYSVDIAGKRIKKSFGSAFKLFSNEKYINILVYSLILILFLLLPSKTTLFNLIKDILNV